MARRVCKTRVWDNGDMTDCGRAALECGLCELCRVSRVKQLRALIAEYKPRLAEFQAELRYIGDYLEDA